MSRNEFDIIHHFFSQQKIERNDVILGIGDDCALVTTPCDQQLAITVDTLVAGVHFPHETSAYDIGYKALAVNLSDLAAMSAEPAWITVALTLHENNETWLSEFSRGLFALANQHRVQLIGGDLTRGPLTITIQAHGFVPNGQAIKRSGAKPGDLIYVANTVGDAAFALHSLKNLSSVNETTLNRLNRPEPQIALGLQLRNVASAAIDVSDGLVADLSHILQSSKVGAIMYVDQIPLSCALQTLPKQRALDFALNGGDDYVLCFTLPREKEFLVKEIADLTWIGTITEKIGLDLRFKDGSSYNNTTLGYRHF